MNKKLLFIALACLLSCKNSTNISYDIIIENARVIDPETNTDAILNIGILKDKIAVISSEKLNGLKRIDGTGKVLAPGFIDLHAHGQTNKENEYQAFDGVTTALELEVGVDTIQGYYAARANEALINFGAAACQLAYRNKAIANSDRVFPSIYEELADSTATLVLPASKYITVREKINNALKNGALGIGVPVGYLPAASIQEITDIYALAGKLNVPIFSHVREGGAIAFQQALSDAILNNTQLHLCHITSMARKDIDFCLEQVQKAQALGYPITTELYPYTAGNTEISSAIFNEGWQERLGCTYEDLQWVATNERLTKESFEKYRKQGGSVIVHMMKENWIEKAIQMDGVLIASDGGGYSRFGHPRSSGTFTKVLRKYVREEKIISLKTAIKKMTLLPAKVLENIAPDMKLRGRIQVGCYADLVLFDDQTVQDNASYTEGFVKSSGMEYVLVNGKILIENGKLKVAVYPGKGIKSQLAL